MKLEILFVFALSLLINSSFGQQYDLQKHIVEQTDSTFKITESTSKGRTIIEGFLKSKEPEIKSGKFNFYSENGNLLCEGEYIDNVPTGIWKYYESENVVKEINYTQAINYFTNKLIAESDTIFQIVEQMPLFGNEKDFNLSNKKFLEYIKHNLKQPIYSQIKGYSGRVIMSFVVDKKGEVKNITVLRGTESLDLNMEAIRIISESPKWTPGIQKGKPLNVRFMIPISFI